MSVDGFVSGSLALLGLVGLIGLGAFSWTSWREGERRAAGVAFGLALASSLLLLLSTYLPTQAKLGVLAAMAIGGAVGIALFALPVGRIQRARDVPQHRFDERDILFARARLEPGSESFQAYYAMRPQNRVGDDRTRSLPGLLSPQARAFHALAFAATDASFGLTAVVREAVDGPVRSPRIERDPRAMAAFVKDMAVYYGARTAGISTLQPYHVYSHVGRGSGTYGAPITLDHRYAVAFTVEMERALVGTAPAAPTVMESARQYVEAAKVALQLANLIRLLGYPARAHIDGNYQVIAPLVARDAGLGEIGRMGLLMTPALGPRVRLGIVTTDLPLIPDPRSSDTSVLDFCSVCIKCAESCPVRAIPHGDRAEVEGALRWRINDELCFRYWNVVGTDCARCMAVCPYSHPDGKIHDCLRWATRHSGVARRAAVRLDDLFYGRVPPAKPWPRWLPPEPDPAGPDA